jgi:hypothetical protein
MAMMDVESLEPLSTMPGVKSRIVEADIKDLAWVWEETLSQARFADPRLAFYVLRAISRSYLRGRDLRMGNHQGLWRHQWTEAGLMTILVKYVADDNVFDCLHQAGVTSVKAFTSALNTYFDILDEANRILQEGGNHERK